MNAMQNYHWPGNIRELENVLERAVINSSGPELSLMDELKNPFKEVRINPKTMEAVERDHIIRTLEQTGWKIGGENNAAEILGLNRSTLRARMLKLGIRKPSIPMMAAPSENATQTRQLHLENIMQRQCV